MTDADQMMLTADVFVVHSGDILLLRRRGRGGGLWYLPGGIVEPGEDPADAAVRETAEESGLELGSVDLLRVWSYRSDDGRWVYHATYAGRAPGRDVVISEEHSDHRWERPADYIARDLANWQASDDRVAAEFAVQVVRNIDLLARWDAGSG